MSEKHGAQCWRRACCPYRRQPTPGWRLTLALVARRVASGRALENRALSRCGGRSWPGRVWEGAFSNRGPTDGGDHAEDRELHEQDRARHGGKPVGFSGGRAVGDELATSRIRPMLVAPLLRSSSSHPLCPCGHRRQCSRGVPLVIGTSATRCASIRIVQPSLRIGASRWVTRGLPDSHCAYRRTRARPHLNHRPPQADPTPFARDKPRTRQASSHDPAGDPQQRPFPPA